MHKKFETGLQQIKDLTKLGSLQDFLYYVEKYKAAYEALTTTYAPFKVGDRAELRVTPRIDKEHAWGWLGSKHFLIAGCGGRVASVDFHDGRFRIGFIPDSQTWIDQHGNLRNHEEESVYMFNDNELIPERTSNPTAPGAPI